MYNNVLERLNLFKRREFDCLYQSSVFEHSANVRTAIKNCIYISKEFHFVFFKWRWTGGGLNSKFYPTKKLYSSVFNIWNIIEEIKLYGIIEDPYICMKKTGKKIPFKQFSCGKKGNHRDFETTLIVKHKIKFKIID